MNPLLRGAWYGLRIEALAGGLGYLMYLIFRRTVE